MHSIRYERTIYKQHNTSTQRVGRHGGVVNAID